jgi:multicomponent Na+:H+ antiporter subunit D
MQVILGVLAGLSILIGVAGAIIQTNIRRILGFHIISQVGYIALAGIFAFSADPKIQVFGIAAAVFYIVHHILVKANLYLVSGLVRSITGSENLSKMSGLISKHGLVALLFALPALSLSGIPPFSGFWAKLGLFQASLASGYYLAVAVMIAGGFFTVYSMSKIWLAAFWGEEKLPAQALKIAPRTALIASFCLSLPSITIGLQPDLLFDQAELAARQLVKEVSHVDR